MRQTKSTGVLRRGAGAGLAATAVVALAAGCVAGPGASEPEPEVTADPEVSTVLTDEEVVLDVYLETNFQVAFKALADLFTSQHPNVTFEFQADTTANLAQNATKIISGEDPPDLVRYTSVAQAAKDGILANLDAYASAYGWDTWPTGTIDQLRTPGDGSRGEGSLYGLGIGYSVTGVYYNKSIAADLGLTMPPATIEEFESYLRIAKDAGVLPIMAGNKDFMVNFAFQALQNQYALRDADGLDQLKDFAYARPGSTFELESSLEAARTIQTWAQNGYFPEDANAIDYMGDVGRFAAGEALFEFNGDWAAAQLDGMAFGAFGFFLFPGETEDSRAIAMSAPATYVIPAQAADKDAMAFFLNWVHTDEVARQIVLDITGSTPGGPADLPQPQPKDGTLAVDTLFAAETVSLSDGAIDFTANATPGIFTTTIGPNLQLLITDRLTPEGYVEAVQAGYETELGR